MNTDENIRNMNASFGVITLAMTFYARPAPFTSFVHVSSVATLASHGASTGIAKVKEVVTIGACT